MQGLHGKIIYNTEKSYITQNGRSPNLREEQAPPLPTGTPVGEAISLPHAMRLGMRLGETKQKKQGHMQCPCGI